MVAIAVLLRATTVAAGGLLPLGDLDLDREVSAPEVAAMIRSRALAGTLMVVFERARAPVGCTSKSGPSINRKKKGEGFDHHLNVVRRTEAIQRCSSRETSIIASFIQKYTSGANALSQTSDTSESCVRFIRVLRCDEFLRSDGQGSHHYGREESYIQLCRENHEPWHS